MCENNQFLLSGSHIYLFGLGFINDTLPNEYDIHVVMCTFICIKKIEFLSWLYTGFN